MSYKPIILVAGEPNSIFFEILFKVLRAKKIKSPLILIASYKILSLQMKRLNFKINIKLLDFKKINDYKLNNSSINLINVNYNQKKAFEKISDNQDKEFEYFSNWAEKEKLVDSEEPIRIKKDQKIWGETLKGIHLSDILTINNWFCYAEVTGDYSYKKIYNNNLNSELIRKYLENQIEFRKKNLFI